MKHDFLIIGGGASGLIAAITAKDRGIDTAIIEGNKRVGSKLLSTGNGRCNISNVNACKEKYHGNNPEFVDYALNKFTVKNTKDFFESIGLHIITLDEGKLFPRSLQASSVLDILRLAVSERDIPVYLDSKIKNVTHSKSGFKIEDTSKNTYECKSLLLACGGKAAPATGSDGSGINIAKSLGHKVIPLYPAITQLKLNYGHLKALSGVKFNGTAVLVVDGKEVRKEYGEILFTDYGISGPPILQLSSYVSYALSMQKKVTLKLYMFSYYNHADLDDYLRCHFGTFCYRGISEALIGLINKKMIPIILKDSGINDIHMPCSSLSTIQIENLIKTLNCWEFEVSGTNPFKNAQCTLGGVDTSMVDPKTLESKIVKNLYFSGEILDICGDCGGYNLQWAWSSGYTAASSVIPFDK